MKQYTFLNENLFGDLGSTISTGVKTFVKGNTSGGRYAKKALKSLPKKSSKKTIMQATKDLLVNPKVEDLDKYTNTEIDQLKNKYLKDADNYLRLKNSLKKSKKNLNNSFEASKDKLKTNFQKLGRKIKGEKIPKETVKLQNTDPIFMDTVGLGAAGLGAYGIKSALDIAAEQ